MKALLICPGPRSAVALLAESAPLAIVPLLGKCLVEYWIEYLVGRSVHDIHILAADRPELISAVVGDGTRWGLHIKVEAETCESNAAEVTENYFAQLNTHPEYIVQMDHLPGRPGKLLFESYAAWFKELYDWIPLAQSIDRIGQCEIEPGVWVGLRTRITPSARFLAPCWLGDHVKINRDAVIGPGAIIEPATIVGAGAHITHSVIGPATFVGAQTKIENSIASRHTLINWSTNSSLRVPDAFWLSSLRGPLCAQRPLLNRSAIKIKSDGNKLHITQLLELSAVNSTSFMDSIRENLNAAASAIEVDLSSTQFMDSCGLATLCSLHRITRALGIRLRLIHPRPAIQQLLKLTQMHEFFEIDGPAQIPAGSVKAAIHRPANGINPEPPPCPA